MRFGLYNPYLSTLGGGENVLARLAEFLEIQFPDAQLDLLVHKDEGIGPAQLCERFGVRLERTSLRVIPAPRTQWDRFLRLDLARRIAHDHKMAEISRQYDFFVNNTIFSTMPCRAPRSLYLCMFPLDPGSPTEKWTPLSYLPRMVNSMARRQYFSRSLGTYSAVASNSKYTKVWTKRFWGIDTEVLYPPVRVPGHLDLSRKRKQILSIGRFFPGDHNKKHRPMIEAFRQMVDAGFTDWEFHLAGGVTPVKGTADYLAELKRLAEGYPIFIHQDAGAGLLDKLLDESSLFWHATGFNEDERGSPDKFEHFGLSTVEAMASGLVPLVLAKGGQPEIITQGQDGYLWEQLDELISYTTLLARDEAMRQNLAESAWRRSQDFGRAAFEKSVRELLCRVGLLDAQVDPPPAKDSLAPGRMTSPSIR